MTETHTAHADRSEGMPHDPDYEVHNRHSRIKCPHCGCRHTAGYIYGYPALTDSMRDELEAGTLVLGGCEVDALLRTPLRRCNGCGKDFATPPLLVDKEKGTAEYYRDIVTAIKFTVGGFPGTLDTITIRKTAKGATVRAEIPYSIEHNPSERQIPPARWRSILDRLYNRMYLHEWKKSYIDLGILDDTQWELEIRLTGNRKRRYHGSNAFPAYWPELIRMFRGVVKREEWVI